MAYLFKQSKRQQRRLAEAKTLALDSEGQVRGSHSLLSGTVQRSTSDAASNMGI